MKLITASDEPLEVRAAAQRDNHYLAAAYPIVFREPATKYSAQYDVPPELLYAVMRNESLFNPDALSPRSALGLFQFIPSTFETLDRRWNLLAKNKAASRESLLLNPDCNIEMGARWFREELLTRSKGHIPFAVMEHNAGYPAVRRCTERWTAQGREEDLEYVLVLDVIAGCAMNDTRRMAGMLVMIAHALIHNHSDVSLDVLVDMANQTNLFCPKNQEA